MGTHGAKPYSSLDLGCLRKEGLNFFTPVPALPILAHQRLSRRCIVHKGPNRRHGEDIMQPTVNGSTNNQPGQEANVIQMH